MKKKMGSIFFVLYELILVLVIDLVLVFIFDKPIFPLLNWFNSATCFSKLIILFFIFGLTGFVFNSVRMLTTLLVSIFDKVYKIKFSTSHSVLSLIFFIGNTIFGIRMLWDSFLNFDFLKILFFTGCAGFIYALNLLLYRKAYVEEEIKVDEEIQSTLEFVSTDITKTETYLKDNCDIVIYTDNEIDKLRLEAKALEIEIQKLSEEKAELEKLLYIFSIRHNKELGEIIIKILHKRKEKSKGNSDEAEATKDYEDFYTNYHSKKEEVIAILTDEEQIELKDKYRKASKLCHPDVVSEDQKVAAHKIFMELKTAYEKNDLQSVRNILKNLQEGKVFKSKAEIVSEKSMLVAELERLRKRLKELKNEIITIKTSETYEKIMNIKDWDKYFTKTKQQLQEQLNQSKHE